MKETVRFLSGCLLSQHFSRIAGTLYVVCWCLFAVFRESSANGMLIVGARIGTGCDEVPFLRSILRKSFSRVKLKAGRRNRCWTRVQMNTYAYVINIFAQHGVSMSVHCI